MCGARIDPPFDLMRWRRVRKRIASEGKAFLEASFKKSRWPPVRFSSFFNRRVCGVLLGFLRKRGVLTWCFCGEVVVFCVVNVVIKQSPFVVMKDVTRIPGLFFGFPVLGMTFGSGCVVDVGRSGLVQSVGGAMRVARRRARAPVVRRRRVGGSGTKGGVGEVVSGVMVRW
jgi:hypothetical protein